MSDISKQPAHVERLNSIEKLEREGFSGPDASVAESIFEYGLAWRKLSEEERHQIYEKPIYESPVPNQPEWFFVYDMGNGKFDRCFLVETDLFIEFNWVEWDRFFTCNDTNKEEWNKLPFPRKIYDLFLFYSPEDIFGSSYWEGFKIKE